MMQVTKVWWDGEKLMAEPIDPTTIYQEPAQQDSTCNKTLFAQGKAYPRTCKKCGLGPCIADRVQPAQQCQYPKCSYPCPDLPDCRDAEQPAQPVAYPEGDIVGPCICGSWPGGKCLKCPRITAPAQRTWVGLTDEEIDLFINGKGDEDDEDYVEPTGDGFGLTDADLVQLVRKSEAKLKEKNT